MLFPDEALFSNSLTDLGERIAPHTPPTFNPLPCDRWIARSCLQKAIRRGEVALAQRALANLFDYDRRATWRHLVIIAVEDVGVANAELLAQIVAAQRDRKWREQAGGDWIVMSALVREMSQSPHCQAVCDLLLRATNDPALDNIRAAALDIPKDDLARTLWDGGAELFDRAIAALALGGGLAEGQAHNDPYAVFEILADACPRTHVVATSRAAWRLSRNPMALLLPLVWEQWSSCSAHSFSDDIMPPIEIINGVPGYALDQFTRAGNEIARAYLAVDTEMRDHLATIGIPRVSQHRVIGDLLFLMEGTNVCRRLSWRLGEKLRHPARMLPSTVLVGLALSKLSTEFVGKAPLIANLRSNYLNRLAKFHD